MAAFANATESLRAARTVISATDSLGLRVRTGIHAGETYEDDGDLFGTCVNIAARICEQAAGGETLVTPVVEGLVEGSDLSFEDRGEAELKGIGKRRLMRLVSD